MAAGLSPNPDLEKKVKDEAVKQKRSFSAQIWFIVEEYFKNKEKSNL
jgi:hypothetical protein